MGNFIYPRTAANISPDKSFYDYTLKTLEGELYPLSSLKGKVVMITNVASKCGYSYKYYNQMVRMHSVFAPFGFEILAIPSREFLRQEYLDPKDIRKAINSFNVKFPVMELSNVNGENALDLINFLKFNTPELYDKNKNELKAISWNFSRFLVNKSGQVVDFRTTTTSPEELIPKIAELLNVKNYQELFDKYDKDYPQTIEYQVGTCSLN
ncbi:glutathione peroxidase family protein [Cryptosporidium andersoni]|uniref:Glutathione peroxidase n=1 Tax=Cryptosporidium andersoni TaxID=117008 RepID=A0A1J4MW79_9CRYT|nr:glutathione peroxidase family protein [Cryptosporidium andersoni]